MPRSSSSNGTTSYRPLSPPKRQRTFPSRRRSANLKPALSKLSKKQSTLTQLDFATPSTKREIIDISSDEECEAPEPKRRKRPSKFDKRDADQSSMTQFERGEIPSLMKRSSSSAVDDDDFTIWQDYSPGRWDTAMAESQRLRASTLARLRENNEDLENEMNEPEIPETSQAALQSSPKIDRGVEKQSRYQTPRKVRFKTEVPSSQTPPSTKHSLRITPPHAPVERSPLKERSGNAQPSYQAQPEPEVEDSQVITSMMLEPVKTVGHQPSLSNVTASMTSGERTRSSQRSFDGDRNIPAGRHPPQLQRITTIQDSQSDNLNNSIGMDVLVQRHVLQLQRISTIPDSEEGDVELTITQIPGSIELQRRKLKRTTTVQDSQWEDIDLENEEAYDDESLNDFTAGQESQYFGLQSTFDPANSALDRDAARFGWTQTQPYLDRIEERDADSETDDEDLDRGCGLRAAGADIQATHESSQLVKEEPVSSQLQQPMDEQVTVAALTQDADVRNTASKTSTHEPSATAVGLEVHIPSSPPALRPSQVSTVMPTQLSQPRPTSRQSDAPREPTKVEAFTFSSSPHQLYSIMPETLSSSPLPLPPWTSPGSFRTGRGQSKAGREGAQLESLVDFSLPPPPPLNSSRRQTPASSST